MIFDKDNILMDNDILELEGIEQARQEQWNTYEHKEVGSVPRVSHILAQCRPSDWLIQWAANVGRRKYDYYREKALTVGTIVHEIVDEYLKMKYNMATPGFIYINKNFEVNYDLVDFEYKENIFNCVENFKLWEKRLNEMGAYIEEVIGIEVPIHCPWYGGTVDAILRINGAVYLIDFKTSKSISTEYLLQAASYMWIINNGYMKDILGDLHIDGIGIIRMEKTHVGTINDLFINDFIPVQHQMILGYQACFGTYLEAYYRTIHTEYITKQFEYIPENVYPRKENVA